MGSFGKLLTFLLLGILVSCPNSSGNGGGGGQNGSFSVALSRQVTAATIEKILAPGATVTDAAKEAVGLAVNVNAVQAGEAPRGHEEGSTQLEVWLTDPDYVNVDGTVKNDGSGSPYLLAWDGYTTLSSPVVASDSKKADDFGLDSADEVVIRASTTAKDSRRRVQVGKALLAAGDTVLLVSVYQPGTKATDIDDETNRLKQFRLTITAAPPSTAPAFDLSALPADTVLTVTAEHGDADSVGSATEGSNTARPAAIVKDAADGLKTTLKLKSGFTAALKGQQIVWDAITLGGSKKADYALSVDAGHAASAGTSATDWASEEATVSYAAVTDPGKLTARIFYLGNDAALDRYGQPPVTALTIELANEAS